MRLLIFLFCSFTLTNTIIKGQEKGLLDELEQESSNENALYLSLFKSTNVVLTPSVVQLAKGELQFRVSHVFGTVTSGIEELYGLDEIYNVDISFDYGISERLSIGIARSSDFDKTLQSKIKYSILRQNSTNTSPISLIYFGGINIRTRQYDIERDFVDRLEYISQLIIGKKFSDSFSTQLSGAFIHLNRVPSKSHPNTIGLTSLGASYSLTRSANLNVEYVYIIPTFDNEIYDGNKNILSVGLDLETGGHVFQVFITNSNRLQLSGMAQQWNNDNFFEGDVHIGFSIMRSFNL
ncbi:hypothetical protein E9993_22600 [Labilibacter sediminis]|nr:hypothetical protein E9993_22600 [Labilibacter sediminis]